MKDHKRRKLWFSSYVMNTRDSLPDEVEALKRLVLARDAELRKHVPTNRARRH